MFQQYFHFFDCTVKRNSWWPVENRGRWRLKSAALKTTGADSFEEAN